MKLVFGLFDWMAKLVTTAVVLLVCIFVLFVSYKGSQPMSVQGVPAGMTYFEFMQDRIEAAKEVEPARCGWGLMLSLAALGPVYSVVYTEVAIHPDGFLAGVSAPDPDIPRNVAGTAWSGIPGIWWSVVENLSWSMLSLKGPGCNFRPIIVNR
jgi:hypothetical protein